MNSRILSVLLAALLAADAASAAESVTKQEVLAAIQVVEEVPLSDRAVEAARVVTQFGEESEEVYLVLNDDTLPWMREDAPESQAAVRAMLMVAYFAGNIKAQLDRRVVEDDPYSGWLLAFKVYGELRKQRGAWLRIAEVEELMELERAGKLKTHAEEIRRKNEEQLRRERMI